MNFKNNEVTPPKKFPLVSCLHNFSSTRLYSEIAQEQQRFAQYSEIETTRYI